MTLVYSFTTKMGNYTDNDWVVIYYKAAIRRAKQLGYRIKLYGCDFIYNNLKDDVDEFVSIENEEFILTDDLKMYIHSNENLDCITIDGDVILESSLNLPNDCDVLFERKLLNTKNKKFKKYMGIFKKYDVINNVEYFDYNGLHASNVGILKFNSQFAKNTLLKSYYTFRKYYLENIEPFENLTEWNDPSIIVCEYYFPKVMEATGISYKFCKEFNNYVHYASETKFEQKFFNHVNAIFNKSII